MQFHIFFTLLFLIFATVTCNIMGKFTRPFRNSEIQEPKTAYIGCFEAITHEMAETYDNFVVYSEGPEMCLIFLPENVEVTYKQLNFTNTETYTRILTGSVNKKVLYRSFPLYATNSTEDYGVFNVACPFGLIAFKSFDPFNQESIEFSLKVNYEPVMWSKTCPTPSPMEE